MRCIVCNNFSFFLICDKCKELLKPTIEFKNEILSFYKYEEIEPLLKYKYEKFGSAVFWELGKVLKVFGDSFEEKAFVIPIDDRIKKGYSHTAILAKSLESKNLKPLFSTLHARNDIKYAGKSLQFRLENPRNFVYKGPNNIDAILIDDIYTTGTTIKEAKEVLEKNGVNVLFSVVLAKV